MLKYRREYDTYNANLGIIKEKHKRRPKKSDSDIMEQHSKYLDELIIAIKESRLTSFDSKNVSGNDLVNNIPIQKSLDEDPKSLKVLLTLLSNLKDENKKKYIVHDNIFGKTIQALDLLISSRPFLLVSEVPVTYGTDETVLGVKRIIKDILLVGMNYYDIPHRLWFLRKHLGKWCNLIMNLYNVQYKYEITAYLLSLITTTEQELSQALNGICPIEKFVSNLKKLYVLCYYLCGPYDVFGSSLTFLDSSMGLNKWDLMFEKIIRFLLFIFGSINISSPDYALLQVKFMSILADLLVSESRSQGSISLNRLKFALETISTFLKNGFGLLNNNNILAKTLLRIYYLCANAENSKEDSNTLEYLNLCVNIFGSEKWVDFDKILLPENSKDLPYNAFTIQALLLIQFDCHRKIMKNVTDLVYNKKYRVWTVKEENEQLLDIICKPLPEELKQLDKLRSSILYQFRSKDQVGLLKYEIDSLDPSLFTKIGKDMNNLYEEIEKDIQDCINAKITNKLVSWTRILGRLGCFEAHSPKNLNLINYENCTICDKNNTHISTIDINPERLDTVKCKAFELLNRLFICNPIVEEFSEGLLCGILFALKRILTHFQPPKLYIDEVETPSKYFNLITKCFSSNSRYLRLVTAKIIPLLNITYLHNKNDENTRTLVRLLQSVNHPITTETVILGWIEFIQTTTGELFDTLLLKLMDIFNSDNYTIHTMMTFQIHNLARTLGKTPYQLLSPILPILLQQFGKSLVQKKASFQRLCDLLGYSGKTILEMFQRYIVPYAVMHHKSDSFGEIARIICDGEIEFLKQQQEEMLEYNSRQIFAVALVKHGIFSLDTLEKLFINRAPQFDKNYVVRFLPDFKTLAEITKLNKYSDDPDAGDQKNERRIVQALRYLITNFEKDKRRGGLYLNDSNWSVEQENRFQKKFQEVILGIFQVYSSDIHNIEGKTTYYEKLRVVNGIMLLIKIVSKKTIISALAQISICLQASLEIKEVRFSAFKAWRQLIICLTDEELSTIIDGFIAFILQKWSTFERILKNLIYEILDILIESKISLITCIKPYVTFALTQKSGLSLAEHNPKFARIVKKTRELTDFIPVFSSNLKSNNRYVILQNLEDIEIFLENRQEEYIDDIFRHDSHRQDISVLLGALLETSHRFRSSDQSICEKCAKCISMIGVLDVTKYSLKDSSNHNNVYFFNDKIQVIKFLIWIINDVIVPAFWQSENPRKQLFFALVMQESLRYCELSSDSWQINEADKFPRQKKLWEQFNTISQTTLYPLMSSLYLAQSWKEYTPLEYPIFNAKESYKTWIRTLALDLLKIGTEENNPLHVFSSLIREDDGHLSNLLLPYIVVDIILKAESKTKFAKLIDNIVVEFRFIFEYSMDNLNSLQRDTLKMAYESIFGVFEYCKKWTTQYRKEYYDKYATTEVTEATYARMLQRLDNFLTTIPPDLLAKRSLVTASYERSILYLEDCYRLSNSEKIANTALIKDLQDMYEKIEDVDSIDGMLKTFTSSNLESKIKELQYSSNWKMAQDCFETLGKYQIDSPATTKMLRSMSDHQLSMQVINRTSLMLPEELSVLEGEKSEWYCMGLEAANLLGNTDILEKWINRVEMLRKTPDHNVLLQYNIAKALYCIHTREVEKLQIYVNNCFKLVGTYFTTLTNSAALVKQQDILMKLHGLYDILLLSSEVDIYQFSSKCNVIDFRLKRVGADFKSNYYLMTLRKSYDLLRHTKYAEKDLSDTYFRIAQMARANSRLDIATDSLMNCLSYGHPQAELEFAEILWKKGENDGALKLVREIHQRYKDNSTINARDAATVLLKYTEWLDLSNNSFSSKIIEQYKEIFKLDPGWDKPYYSMGLYYSRLLERKKEEGYTTTGYYEYQAVSFFLMAFERNICKVRENLPKVVTFWLDITSLAVNNNTKVSTSATIQNTTALEICNAISTSFQTCPTYMWYSVLTQLLSRLLHPFPQSAKLIREILLKLAIDFPEHIFWYIAALMNSTNTRRRRIGDDIAKKLLSKTNQAKLMTSAKLLTSEFTKVCVSDIKDIKDSLKSLKGDFDFKLDIAPTALAVPVRINLEMLSPTLPIEKKNTHKAFRSLVSIESFSDKYKVFSSLKKPKQVNIIGSDGHIYGIMCKMEDVRQDNQYMQFATTMDFLLSKDVESAKRKLGILTYSVLSLREDCGLLEIVPNVVTLRSILVNKYDRSKFNYSLGKMYAEWKDLQELERRKFFQKQVSKFVPQLYKWFLETFPDPIKWFNARNRYTRSYAVMAMVGHILGLGDRHCENILLDVETGNILHVDFDCLFEKGKQLPVPEIVPFRLTQNITDAFGIIGTEGTFKKSSEVTLSLMRRNEVSLVNVIETIMYDRSSDTSLHHSLKILRNKVRGIDPRDGLVLSVPGQVETLIQEATSFDNLAAMYIGWLAFW